MTTRFVGILVPCLAALACAQATGSFHRSFHVHGPVMLNVSTGSGAIQVTGAPGSAVVIDATIRQSDDWWHAPDPNAIRQVEQNPPLEQNGNTILVRRVSEPWSEHISISYVITTPPETTLEAHSGSGHIEIAGLKANADLQAGSGGLDVRDLDGALHAQTGSGRITFGRITGEVRASAGSGSIEGDEAGGRLGATTGSGHIRVRKLDRGGELHTGSGGIDLDEVSGGDLAAHGASGSLHIGGVLGANQSWNLSTASGSIHITLPQAASAEVRLQTGSGGISIDHPTQRQSQLSRHSWEGVIGSAGSPTATLIAHTSSGSITVN